MVRDLARPAGQRCSSAHGDSEDKGGYHGKAESAGQDQEMMAQVGVERQKTLSNSVRSPATQWGKLTLPVILCCCFPPFADEMESQGMMKCSLCFHQSMF